MGLGTPATRGECEPGDLFILATDALACWFLATNAAKEKAVGNAPGAGPVGLEGLGKMNSGLRWSDAERRH